MYQHSFNKSDISLQWIPLRRCWLHQKLNTGSNQMQASSLLKQSMAALCKQHPDTTSHTTKLDALQDCKVLTAEVCQTVFIAGRPQQISVCLRGCCMLPCPLGACMHVDLHVAQHHSCRGFESGSDGMRQCSTCSETFCSLCSVPDYDKPDVRYFCLECNRT